MFGWRYRMRTQGRGHGTLFSPWVVGDRPRMGRLYVRGVHRPRMGRLCGGAHRLLARAAALGLGAAQALVRLGFWRGDRLREVRVFGRVRFLAELLVHRGEVAVRYGERGLGEHAAFDGRFDEADAGLR